jgi:uncharacterized membrane-anchored protein
MGLRAAISLALIPGVLFLGAAVAGADAKHGKAEPAKPDSSKASAKPAAKPGGKPAAAPAAERGDPADPADEADDAAAADEPEAGSDRMPPHIVGPKHVELGNGTAIDLPEGMILLERTEAQALLRESGDSPEGVVAMVFKPGSDWHLYVEYADSGYIDDSDAEDLDADDLLESYRTGNKEQNKTRKALGKPELVIDSWTEPPRYDRAAHHLVWGLAAHATDGKVVNFFTRILGRNGYLSLDLIAAPEQLEAAKKEAAVALQAVKFKGGATYADHSSSDKSSGIGLRGLVLGGAGVAVASKLGFIAKILLVFKKGLIVVVAAIGGLFRWLFRRKPRDQPDDPLAGLAVSDPTGAPPPPMQPPPTQIPPSDGSSG